MCLEKEENDFRILLIYFCQNVSFSRLWSRSHDQGSFWKIASIELKPIRSTYSIEIEAIANGYIGYIDIDDIIVSDDSHCKLKSVCDFEDGMCDYDLMLAESDFIWLRSNGGSAGGPAVDHTTGSPQGSLSLNV